MKKIVAEPKKVEERKREYKSPRISHEDSFARTSLGACTGANAGCGFGGCVNSAPFDGC